MTTYRERLKAGVHDAQKIAKAAQAKAQRKADAAMKAKAEQSTTTDKIRGIA